MEIKDKHLFHGAAIIQIAEDEHFTAINPLQVNGATTHNAFLINTNIAVYPKYASNPKGKHKEYQFTFKQENIEELERIHEHHPNVYVLLVCVHDREVCCLTYAQFRDLYNRRVKQVGHEEEQFVILATLPARKFRVYVNAPGVRGKLIGKEILVARSGFPGMLFS